jgi:hypothetical protein
VTHNRRLYFNNVSFENTVKQLQKYIENREMELDKELRGHEINTE